MNDGEKNRRLVKPEFTRRELQAMHRYCLKYRELVRSGSKPTAEQDENFLLFQRVTYSEGVACA